MKKVLSSLLFLFIFLVFLYSFDVKIYKINFTDTSSGVSKIQKQESIEIGNFSDVEKYKVKFVIDGDTFILSDGRKVRLIGIDTPERFKDYYGEAKKRMMELVLYKDVLLVKDISEVDKYNRLLRYVYVDNIFVNLKMIEDGYARALIISPDVKYRQVFIDAQNIAIKNGLGIWSYR